VAPLSRSCTHRLSSSSFDVSVNRSTAGDFHARDLPKPIGREAWVFEVEQPAVVLGSSQNPDIVNHAECAARGIEVVSRRSGGGLVLVEPGEQAWIDILLPADDPLWVDDLSHAFDWVGALWKGALAGLGIDAAVHSGALAAGDWGKLVCFGSRGPGELFVADAKVVGMSLRRTRHGARFQTMALSGWHPETLVALLAAGRADHRRLLEDLNEAAVGTDIGPADLSKAFLSELASLS
jgi:lipoate-protein ligase A